MTEESANDLKLRVAMYNAAREPGESIMTDSGMIVGPGDVAQIIDEPDYEKSLEISAQIFGGDKELYRTCGMTQEAWAALGNPDRAPVQLPPGFTRTDEDLQLAFVEPDKPSMIDVARAYMELADRHL